MKYLKLTILLSLLAGSVPAMAVDANAFLGSYAVKIQSDQPQTLSGAAAQVLLQALPSEANSYPAGSKLKAAANKHFRYLFLANQDGKGFEINCSSAEWIYGQSRIGGATLTSAEPKCTIQVSEDDTIYNNGMTLQQALEQAASANSINVQLPIVDSPSFPPICKTRSC